MKKIIFATILLGLISCDQNNFEHEEYKSTYTENQLLNELENAYAHQSKHSIENFFADWNKSVKQNSIEFINQNNSVKSIFEIYRTFYQPLDLLKLGDWEWGNSLNMNSKYVVVQNKMYYYIMPNDNFDNFLYWNENSDSIIDFRPPIDVKLDKVLYLMDEYHEAVNRFLGSESSGLGEGNIMNPSRPIEESQKRYNFLREFIPILHGHWGGYWHIETHPEVSVIILNKKLDRAIVHFRVGYQGGEATLVKNNNKWTVQSSMATWIE